MRGVALAVSLTLGLAVLAAAKAGPKKCSREDGVCPQKKRNAKQVRARMDKMPVPVAAAPRAASSSLLQVRHALEKAPPSEDPPKVASSSSLLQLRHMLEKAPAPADEIGEDSLLQVRHLLERAPAPADETGENSLLQARHLLEMAPPPAEERGEAAGGCTIFTMYDYAGGAPDMVQLNLESWQRHAQGRCAGPVLINDTNVRQYIPDVPDEFFRVQDLTAKSDLVRYALIFWHGGLYLDTDVLVARDLGPVIERLPRNDLVSYETEGQSCLDSGSFSSNILGGRKGSEILEQIWLAQKAKLTRHCVPEEATDQPCCYDDGTTCTVPWASLGERTSHLVLEALLRGEDGQRLREGVFCFAGKESFSPDRLWVVLKEAPSLQEGLAMWAERGVEAPLDRTAYHLYNGALHLSTWKRSDFLNESTVLGELYRRSFAAGAEEKPPLLETVASPPLQQQLSLKELVAMAAAS